MKRTIRLRGVNGAVKGRAWESTELLRVGRLDPVEIVLDDSSVSRYHAELRLPPIAAGASATSAAPTVRGSTVFALATANGLCARATCCNLVK